MGHRGVRVQAERRTQDTSPLFSCNSLWTGSMIPSCPQCVVVVIMYQQGRGWKIYSCRLAHSSWWLPSYSRLQPCLTWFHSWTQIPASTSPAFSWCKLPPWGHQSLRVKTCSCYLFFRSWASYADGSNHTLEMMGEHLWKISCRSALFPVSGRKTDRQEVSPWTKSPVQACSGPLKSLLQPCAIFSSLICVACSGFPPNWSSVKAALHHANVLSVQSCFPTYSFVFLLLVQMLCDLNSK